MNKLPPKEIPLIGQKPKALPVALEIQGIGVFTAQDDATAIELQNIILFFTCMVMQMGTGKLFQLVEFLEEKELMRFFPKDQPEESKDKTIQ